MSQKIYFTPGPTQLYFTVQDHLKAALKEDVMSISHRSKAFEKIFSETRENVSELLDLPSGYDIYFTSSANEIWERIVQNLVHNKSHHFVNGSFAQKFYNFALDYQKQSTATVPGNGKAFDDLSVPEDTELISVTLNETSIGYGFETQKIEKLRANHPDKLIAVDGVSAFPAVPFNFSLADTAYFSVQKSFGLPSGLGVWIVNEKCYAKADDLTKNGVITGSYHQLNTLRKSGIKNQTPETPNTLGIYLLGKVAKDMLFRSAKAIQNETTYKSTVLYQAIEKSSSMTPFILNKANRSKTVIVAQMEGSNSETLKALSEKGWIIGSGYGNYKSSHLRIANFPMHSKEVVEQLADTLSVW